MAAFIGNNGTVLLTASTSFAAVVLNVFRWSVNIASDYYDRATFTASATAGSYSKQLYRGPYKITGSLSLYLDSVGVFNGAWIQPGNDEAANKQITATLTLYPAGNATPTVDKPKFAGKAILHDWAMNVKRIGGLNTATVNFRNQDEWTMGVQT